MSSNYETFAESLDFLESYYSQDIDCKLEFKDSVLAVLNSLPSDIKDNFDGISLNSLNPTKIDLSVFEDNLSSIAEFIRVESDIDIGDIFNTLSAKEQSNNRLLVIENNIDQDISIKSKFSGSIILGGGDDLITSTSNKSINIDTGNGDNDIRTSSGKDLILTGINNDTVVTGSRSDTVIVAGGNDSIKLGAGKDVVKMCDEISGNNNLTIVRGGIGNDTLDFSGLQINAPIVKEKLEDGISYYKVEHDHGTIYFRSFSEFIYDEDSYTLAELIGLSNDTPS